MADSKKEGKSRKRIPRTLEEREDEMILLSMDLIKKRILAGTATSQESTHFAKLGSVKAKLEMETIRQQNKLLAAKTEQLESAARMEEMYADALQAMSKYNGVDSGEDIDE